MSFWVLDTDHVSLFQQNHPILTERINAVNPEEIGVTVITLEEQFYGRLNGIRRANSTMLYKVRYICDRTIQYLVGAGSRAVLKVANTLNKPALPREKAPY